MLLNGLSCSLANRIQESTLLKKRGLFGFCLLNCNSKRARRMFVCDVLYNSCLAMSVPSNHATSELRSSRRVSFDFGYISRHSILDTVKVMVKLLWCRFFLNDDAAYIACPEELPTLSEIYSFSTRRTISTVESSKQRQGLAFVRK